MTKNKGFLLSVVVFAAVVAGFACVPGLQVSSGGGGDPVHDTTTTITSSGGTAGSSGGSTPCVPNESVPCYSGPDGTLGLGACAEGKRVCSSDGSEYGACVGDVLPSVEICSSQDQDENCDSVAQCVGNCMWAKNFNANPDQFESGVAVDSHWNVVVVGQMRQPISLGEQVLTCPVKYQTGCGFVAKFSAAGTPIWGQAFEQSGAKKVVVDNKDNILVGFGGAVRKLDADGNAEWTAPLTSSLGGLTPTVMAVDKAGNTFVGGTFHGEANLSGQPLSSPPNLLIGFLTRISAIDGTADWAKAVEVPDDVLNIGNIVVDETGNAMVAGSFHESVSFDGQPVLTAANGYNIFTAKIKGEDGTTLWAKTYGSSGQNGIADMVLGTPGHVIVTGNYTGELDLEGTTLPAPVSGGAFFIAELETDMGKGIWATKYADDQAASANSRRIARDADGNIIVAGHYAGEFSFPDSTILPIASGQAFFIAKVATTVYGAGKVYWSKGFSSFDSLMLWGMAADMGGSVSVVGSFFPKLDLGGTTLQAETYDTFVVRFRP